MAVKVICGDAADFKIKADLIFTDPPFELDGKKLAEILDQYESDHLVMICSMKQLLEFSKHTNFKLNFDLVIDLVAPKQSKSANQPFYRHANVVYMTRNGAKTKFNRKRSLRLDVLSGEAGYFPTILVANSERKQDHGHAKNMDAIFGILTCFNIKSIADPFAGSGTTALACIEINDRMINSVKFAKDRVRINDITLIEKDQDNANSIKQALKFLGEIVI